MKIKLFLLVFAASLLLSSCGRPTNLPDVPEDLENEVATPFEPENEEPAEDKNMTFSSEIEFPETYTVGSYNKDVTAMVTLDGYEIKAVGQNVSVSGNTVTVTNSGTYVFSGKLSDGQIIVDSTGAEKVSIVLNGVDITSSTTAAIKVLQSGDKVELKIAKNSVNIVSDASTRESTDESNAAIYSQDDLEIESEGTLYVKGNYEKGIHSKDDLELREATVYIEALDDGLRGKDSVTVESGSLIIYCGADGIRTNNETDEGKGYVSILGGKIEINAGLDAIQAVTDVNIYGGDLTLVSGGGSVNSSTSSDSGWGNWGGFGGMGRPGGFDGQKSSSTSEETASAKGIKASNSLNISGGNLNIDSSDDAIHSNGSVSISGGTFTIKSGDDGIHADTDLLISSGVINIEKSYEGIEGLDITISGGEIDLIASDDGLNAAGGSDQSSMNGRPGQNGFGGGRGGFGGGMFENPVGSITITGGNLTVNAAGDGIDSNGSLTVTGGYTVVYGPTDSGNGPLDYTSEFLMNGGTFAAMGSYGMAQDISSNSAQTRTFVRVSAPANSTVKITDSKGKVIFETTSPKSYSCLLVSTPEMVSGEEYSFYFDGELAGSVAAK